MRQMLMLGVTLALTAATACACEPPPTLALASRQQIDGTDYNIWRMLVTSTTDWTNARLDVNLTAGHMYASPFGGNTEPTRELQDALPNLEYHTWLTVPAGGGAPAVLADEIIMPTATGQKTRIGASWGNTDPADIGTFSIAQITLASDARGTGNAYSFDVCDGGAAVPVPLSFEIVDGMILTGGVAIVPGDATKDGFVDDWDLNRLLSNWRQAADFVHGNFNTDDVVDDADLNLLLANWTGSPDTIDVPEPATLVLLAVAGMALIRRTRKGKKL